MTEKKTINISDDLANTMIQGIFERKGLDVVLMDFSEIANVDFEKFIVCHGTSSTHSAAIADSVIDEVINTLGEKPWHIEGNGNTGWILLDYSNIIVHIFQQEVRQYYQLEELWADAKIVSCSDEKI